MKKSLVVIGIFLCVMLILSMSFTSANLFSDIGNFLKKIFGGDTVPSGTGKVVGEDSAEATTGQYYACQGGICALVSGDGTSSPVGQDQRRCRGSHQLCRGTSQRHQE